MNDINDLHDWRTITSISGGGTEGEYYELGSWAEEEDHTVQMKMHLEYWKTKFPLICKVLDLRLGQSISGETDEGLFFFSTQIILCSPGADDRPFGFVHVVKEIIQ